ncbi:MAG: hypothetical protein IPN26_16675 [Bacteroidetes bacterium]|nr:hypothetical protein [Bacteroidota bacterium]
MEGVEKGSEIEYVFQVNQRYRDYGTITLQDAIPTVLNRFELVAPEALVFEIKGYNGVVVSKDTIVNGKNCIVASATNLEGLEEEKYATYFPHFARAEYVLAYNLANKGKGIRVSQAKNYWIRESIKNVILLRKKSNGLNILSKQILFSKNMCLMINPIPSNLF